jgi:hypothetical protein
MKSKQELREVFEIFGNLTAPITDFEPVMRRLTSRWDVIPNGRRIKRKKKR